MFKNIRDSYRRFIIPTVGVVLIVCAPFYSLFWTSFFDNNELDRMGKIGDSFNSVTTLISLLVFFVAWRTLEETRGQMKLEAEQRRKDELARHHEQVLQRVVQLIPVLERQHSDIDESVNNSFQQNGFVIVLKTIHSQSGGTITGDTLRQVKKVERGLLRYIQILKTITEFAEDSTAAQTFIKLRVPPELKPGIDALLLMSEFGSASWKSDYERIPAWVWG